MSIKSLLLTAAALSVFVPVCALAQNDPAATSPAVATATPTAITPAATPAAANPNAPITRAELPALIKEALMNDPNIIIDSVKKFHEQQKDMATKEVEKALEKFSADLFKGDAYPSLGEAASTDVAIVEFFDYHCGYCKRMLPVIAQLAKEDPKVRIIFRDFPILSEDSNMAAKAALAVQRIDKTKYFPFHTALMNHTGKYDEKELTELAKKVGVDGKKLKKEMESPEVAALLDKTRSLADELGIRGTPAVIVGKQVLPGAVSYDDLKKMIATARAGTNAAPAATPSAQP